MARAYASQLTEADLRTLLEELAPNLSYAYVESTSSAAWSTAAEAAISDGATRGRVFGPRCDVQFRREGDGYAVTVITDISRAASGMAESLDLGELDAEEVTYLLWGRREAGGDVWVEPGSRQQWRYPVDGAPGRVGVRALEYRDRERAHLQFMRYLELVAVEEAG